MWGSVLLKNKKKIKANEQQRREKRCESKQYRFSRIRYENKVVNNIPDCIVRFNCVLGTSIITNFEHLLIYICRAIR